MSLYLWMICLDLFDVALDLLICISLFTGKVIFHLNGMEGTWVSFEVHYAVSRGYVIEEIYEQHNFPQQCKTLFADYNKTFFDIKLKAKWMVTKE